MVSVAADSDARGAPLAVAQAAARHAHVSLPSLTASGLVAGTVASLLLVDALLRPRAFFDVWASRRVQALDFPHVAEIVYALNCLTGSRGAILMWLLTLLAFALGRKWLPALATLTLPLGGFVNEFIGEVIVGRERPSPDLVQRTVSDIHAKSFPSGHVMGAVLLYGLLFFVARRFSSRRLRLAIQLPSVFIIAAVGFTRVWAGAHWPSDVLGAYAFGGVFLALLFAAYRRVESAAGGLPFVHAGPVPHDEARPHAHALTSTIIFNEADGTVAKLYNPGFLPRALYWLSFQAPFPYVANQAALRAARERRELAGQLTEYWFGERVVARMTRIERAGERYALVSEYVHGTAPSDRTRATAFLTELRTRFEAAGLPTWQINPRQPRAVDNVLETADGRYHIVDLESGLVAPLASPRTWARALRRGQAPLFDDVFFDITRAYVDREADAMRAAQGDAWLARLTATIARAEAAANEWHASEPRVWNLLLRPRAWRERARARAAAGQRQATVWLDSAVSSWQADGRIDARKAAELRARMRTPQFQAVLPHFGAHVALSVVLRFPLGSIARVAWSFTALLAATARLIARRSDRRAWVQAFGMLSPLVILLAAVPGFGAFAYLAARPVLANRLLLRVTLDAALQKAPWKLYEHSRLRRVIALPANVVTRQPQCAAPRCDTRPLSGHAPEPPVVFAQEPWRPAEAAWD
jgi:undecaprenyl-diphosphatase